MASRMSLKLSRSISTKRRSLSGGSGSAGPTGQIGHNADYEGEFFHLNGATSFHVIGNLDSGWRMRSSLCWVLSAIGFPSC